MQLPRIADALSFPCYFMPKLLTGSETNTAEARNVLEAGRGGMTPSGSWTRQTKTSHALCKTTATTGKLTLILLELGNGFQPRPSRKSNTGAKKNTSGKKTKTFVSYCPKSDEFSTILPGESEPWPGFIGKGDSGVPQI